MNNRYEACDPKIIEFFYNMCRNAHIMGLSWFGMKKNKVSCMDDGRFLFVLDDLPDEVPFRTGAVTRVSDLYKRLKFFIEVSNPETIEVFYMMNKDDTDAIQKIKFQSDQSTIEFRFAHVSAINKMPGKIEDGITDDNIIEVSKNDKKNMLKGLNAVSSEAVTLECENGKLSLVTTDTLGDEFRYNFTGLQKCQDFTRTFERNSFCKIVHQQEDGFKFWVGQTKFMKSRVNNLDTFILMKGQ